MVNEKLRKNIILVVDDDPFLLQSLKMKIGMLGYSVKTDKGEEKLQNVVETYQPNLVLLDTEISKLRGYDLCAELRNTLVGKHLGIIGMSTNRDYESKWRQAGADLFLDKMSISLGERAMNNLESAIKMVLGRYEK